VINDRPLFEQRAGYFVFSKANAPLAGAFIVFPPQAEERIV